MIRTLCVLALVALSLVEGQDISRPAQQGGAGGLMVPMTGPTGQPTLAGQPSLLPQPRPYDIFDWLFNDYNYNTNDNGAVMTPNKIPNNALPSNNMMNNNNGMMNNDMLLAMMMGFDFGF